MTIFQQKYIDYIEKWPFMVIFQYNLYIFGIHLWTVLYPKPCDNEPYYTEVEVYLDYYVTYIWTVLKLLLTLTTSQCFSSQVVWLSYNMKVIPWTWVSGTVIVYFSIKMELCLCILEVLLQRFVNLFVNKTGW